MEELSKERQDTLIESGYAKNMDEWWFLVDHHWSDLRMLFQIYLTDKEVEKVDVVKEERGAVALYTLLHLVWDGLPDNYLVQSLPGFGVLCDLCSDFPYRKAENDEQEGDVSEVQEHPTSVGGTCQQDV